MPCQLLHIDQCVNQQLHNRKIHSTNTWLIHMLFCLLWLSGCDYHAVPSSLVVHLQYALICLLVCVCVFVCVCVCVKLTIIGASLSMPHIDHDNGTHAQNNGMSVCIIYPVFVAPWFPRSVYASKCSVYSCILTYSHMWSTTEQQRQSTTLCCENYWRRQVCALGVNLQTYDVLLIVFCDLCSYWHRQTLSLLHQCLCVICWCRAVQYWEITCTAGYVAIVTM